MGQMMKAFTDGFVKGAKETPRGFFAPAIMLVRFMVWVTESAMHPPEKAKSKTSQID